MARETKVGLLAGLAFIICFAVILANRGANGPPGLKNSFLPDGGLTLPQMVQRNPAANSPSVADAHRGLNRQPRQPAQSPAATRTPRIETLPPGQSYATNDPAPGSGAQLPQSIPPEPARLNPDSALALHTQPVEVPSPAVMNAELQQALTSAPGLDSMLRNEGQVRMAATPAPASALGRIALNETAPGAQPAIQPVTPIQGTPYTVKPSDTLSSIASAHYGTRSKRAIETIFDANRNILTDINHVKSGTVLMIPNREAAAIENNQLTATTESPTKPTATAERIASADKKKSENPAPPGASSKPVVKKVANTLAGSEKAAKNFKWYQVKKNDRFASIARDQLGDAGRWQEVYELNKDKFPDPNRIREGVRIKLPVNAALASAGKGSKEKKR